jgi:uridine kinase
MEKLNWSSGLLNIKECLQQELNFFGEKPFLIVITGCTCSGKTFLAKELSDILYPLVTPVISIDDYYKDIRDQTLPRDENGHPLFNCPEAYRFEELLKDISELRRGRGIWTPKYDMSANTYLDKRGTWLNPSQALIVEGLFAINFLNGFAKQLKIYLDLDFDLALRRCVARDTQKYQIDADKISRVFSKKVWPNQLEFVVNQKNDADIIIYQ